MKRIISVVLMVITVIGCSKAPEPVKETKKADVSSEILKMAEEGLKKQNASIILLPKEFYSGKDEILTINARFLKRTEVVPDAAFISYWMVIPDGKYSEIKDIEDLKPYLKTADTEEKAVKISKFIAPLILSKRSLQAFSMREGDNKDNFSDLVNAVYREEISEKDGYWVVAYKDIKDMKSCIAEINFDKNGKLEQAKLKVYTEKEK